jgi:saccharopine dehydrogenase (NAD+, L-lysine-forming)
MKIGIIKEEKIPRDKRVPFTPQQCAAILNQFPGVEIIVQPCEYRCFKNEEYLAAGITLKEDISDCDLLMGIKEVPKQVLLTGKKYFFFSHTIKKQPHNKGLLKTILEKKIELVDYECLTDPQGNRVIGFGRFAGIVGAYNGMMAY